MTPKYKNTLIKLLNYLGLGLSVLQVPLHILSLCFRHAQQKNLSLAYLKWTNKTMAITALLVGRYVNINMYNRSGRDIKKGRMLFLTQPDFWAENVNHKKCVIFDNTKFATTQRKWQNTISLSQNHYNIPKIHKFFNRNTLNIQLPWISHNFYLKKHCKIWAIKLNLWQNTVCLV